MFRERQYGEFTDALQRLFELESYSEEIKEKEVLGIEREKWYGYFAEMRAHLEYRRTSVANEPLEWIPTLGEVCVLYKTAFWNANARWDPKAQGDDENFHRQSIEAYLNRNDVHPAKRIERILEDPPQLPGQNDALWDLYDYPKEIAEQIFFFAVNAGVPQCVREIQRALSVPQLGYDRGRLTIDGKFGPATKRAMTYADPDLFLAAFTAHCEGLYRLLEAKTQGDFPAESVIRNRIYGG